jgi:hypothetical protein
MPQATHLLLNQHMQPGESYHSTYATEKPKNTYYWPEKKDEATYAKLPPYRDVAFVDGDAFFDASS